MDTIERERPAPEGASRVGDEGGAYSALTASQSSSPVAGAGQAEEAVYVPKTELSERQVAIACAEAMRLPIEMKAEGVYVRLGAGTAAAWVKYEPWRDHEQWMRLIEAFPMVARQVFDVVWLAKNTSEGSEHGRYRERIYRNPMKLLPAVIANRWRSEKGRATLG